MDGARRASLGREFIPVVSLASVCGPPPDDLIPRLSRNMLENAGLSPMPTDRVLKIINNCRVENLPKPAPHPLRDWKHLSRAQIEFQSNIDLGIGFPRLSICSIRSMKLSNSQRCPLGTAPNRLGHINPRAKTHATVPRQRWDGGTGSRHPAEIKHIWARPMPDGRSGNSIFYALRSQEKR